MRVRHRPRRRVLRSRSLILERFWIELLMVGLQVVIIEELEKAAHNVHFLISIGF